MTRDFRLRLLWLSLQRNCQMQDFSTTIFRKALHSQCLIGCECKKFEILLWQNLSLFVPNSTQTHIVKSQQVSNCPVDLKYIFNNYSTRARWIWNDI